VVAALLANGLSYQWILVGAVLGGAVGASTALTSLVTNAGGTTAINGGSVKTSGTQTYNDSVTLGNNTTLTASTVTLADTLTGGSKSLAVTGNAVLGGAVTGLAWTATGGELMTIEALRMPGVGKLTVTGQLGDVMRESTEAAYSFVRSRAATLSIAESEFRESDMHLHVPAGAVPKDGPSAGIAVTLALASALSRRPVRRDLALTGEVTLRGKVLVLLEQDEVTRRRLCEFKSDVVRDWQPTCPAKATRFYALLHDELIPNWVKDEGVSLSEFVDAARAAYLVC
jgi:hypothetical protein